MPKFGFKFSKESINKMRLAHIGKKPSQKTKDKMSITRKGRVITWGNKISLAKRGKKIKPHSEEWKRRVSIANKGGNIGSFKKGQIPWNKNTKGVMSAWNKNKKLSKEHRNKAIKNLKPGWNKGLKMDKEWVERLKQNRLKQVLPFKDTSIEIKLQNFLKEQGIEFSTHYPVLGQPDIFIAPNICIFADGCYWHKCPTCGKGNGRERDEMVTQKLQKQGYVVIRLWEHEIKKLNSLSWLK